MPRLLLSPLRVKGSRCLSNCLRFNLGAYTRGALKSSWALIPIITVHKTVLYCKRIFGVSELRKWFMHLQQKSFYDLPLNFYVKKCIL